MAFKIYINERLADVSPDQVFALTFQRNELSEIRDRQASYSNTLKLPPTENNKRILGSAQVVGSGSNLKYTFLAVRAMHNGVNLLQDSVGVLRSASALGFELTIHDRIISFWKKIDGLQVADAFADPLVQAEYNHFKRANAVHALNTKPDAKIVYPLIQWQQMPVSTAYTNEVYLPYFLPCVFVKDIIEQIIKSAGYVLESNIVNDPLYRALVIPLIGEESEFQWQAINILPDMSQKDFIKAISFLLGVDFIQKRFSRNVIITQPFDHPLKSQWYNWSNRIDFSREIKSEFHWGKWGANNRFKYQDDEIPVGDGGVDLFFGNRVVTEKYDAITLPFAMSGTRSNFNQLGISVARIPFITEVDDQTNTYPSVTSTENRKPRILVLDRAQININYTDPYGGSVSQNGGVPFAYFPEELTIRSVLENKYKLLRRIFSAPLKLTLYMNLRPADIESLDLSRLVYLNMQDINGLFIINKVAEYQQNRTTKVELIRAGSQQPLPLITESGFLIDAQGNYAVDAQGNRVTENY